LWPWRVVEGRVDGYLTTLYMCRFLRWCVATTVSIVLFLIAINPGCKQTRKRVGYRISIVGLSILLYKYIINDYTTS
jgi:hypothetical protein